MRYHILIPARTDSNRLPRKLYEKIGGVSVIERTWRQCLKSSAASVTIVTKDREMSLFCGPLGFNATTWETNGKENNGTEACAQAIAFLPHDIEDIFVNVQGDDCFIDPEAIELCVSLVEGDMEVATLVVPLSPVYQGTSVVKAVVKDDFVKYFSRVYGQFAHIGIYAFSSNLLRRYHSLKSYEVDLEGTLILLNNIPIKTALWEKPYPGSINIALDLERARLRELVKAGDALLYSLTAKRGEAHCSTCLDVIDSAEENFRIVRNEINTPLL